jgi:hypothetical protein
MVAGCGMPAAGADRILGEELGKVGRNLETEA